MFSFECFIYILSQQMPSVLFCCCKNLLLFLSPGVRVRVCVRVRALLFSFLFFFYQFVTYLDVFYFLWKSCQRDSHLFAKRLWCDRLMYVALRIICCVNLSQRRMVLFVQRRSKLTTKPAPFSSSHSICFKVATVDCFTLFLPELMSCSLLVYL